ncbi:hypothetical protein G6F24_016667 [Rhizopus arrhizus]|nr:hypothetical protein G6F24_016667 [Rhizopus arrhizus]
MLARPIGGILFGHFGDRVGRKSMLTLRLLQMGLCTVLIGLLPTYEQIGISAAVLLVVLRIGQGLRTCAAEVEGGLRQPAAGGCAPGHPVVGGLLRAGDAAAGSRLPVLGLAPAVPRQRRAHRRGPVHPPRHR